MRQLYYTLLAVALIVAVGLFVSRPSDITAHEDDIEIMFSHELHQELAECGDCHNAAESDNADDMLMPAPQSCTNCHEEEEVRAYWNADESVNLEMVMHKDEPSELYFSHVYHLETIKMECNHCHILAADEFLDPNMDGCFRCHNNAEGEVHELVTDRAWTGTNMCESCHKNLSNLKPKDHMVPDFSRFHGRMAMNGENEEECAMCHSEAYCEQCHHPMNEVPHPATSDDVYIEGWPRSEKMDTGEMLTVQSAHSLTYRYTHGFDARAQSSRCETCHERESFCTPCHENGYDANGARVVPQSHMMAGFASASRNAALNRHGRLAQMNMESCVTCHNVDGGDPVCAVCHSSGFVGGDN